MVKLYIYILRHLKNSSFYHEFLIFDSIKNTSNNSIILIDKLFNVCKSSQCFLLFFKIRLSTQLKTFFLSRKL